MQVSIGEALRIAVAKHRAGDYADAQPIYEQVIAQDADNHTALQLLAHLLHQQNQFSRAADCFERSLSLAPNQSAVHNNYGNLLKAVGDFERAKQHFRTAIALEPAYIEARYNLAPLQSPREVADGLEQLERHVFPAELSLVDKARIAFLRGTYQDRTDDYEQAAMDHLGLTLHNDCLEFHQSSGPVGSASQLQVRQPLYQSSIGVWRRYAEFLGPALDVLSDQDDGVG